MLVPRTCPLRAVRNMLLFIAPSVLTYESMSGAMRPLRTALPDMRRMCGALPTRCTCVYEQTDLFIKARSDEIRRYWNRCGRIAAIEAIRTIDTLRCDNADRRRSARLLFPPGLAYYLSGEINDKLLFPQIADEFRKFHVNSVKGLVARITPASHSNLICRMAPPSSTTDCSWQPEHMPQHCPSPAQNYPVWLKLDHLEDARRILKLAGRGKTAV